MASDIKMLSVYSAFGRDRSWQFSIRPCGIYVIMAVSLVRAIKEDEHIEHAT